MNKLRLMMTMLTGAFGLLVASAQPPASTASQAEALAQSRLVFNGNNLWLELGAETIELGSTPKSIGPLAAYLQDGKAFLKAGRGAAAVRCSGFPGWEAYLPHDSAAAIQLEPGRGLIQASAPEQNRKPIFLYTDAGAQAELRPGSRASIEFFANGAHLLRGAGDAIATDADGKKVALADPGATVSAGPANGVDKGAPRRATAQVEVVFSGTVGHDLRVTAAGQTIDMRTSPRQTLEIPSLGARIRFQEVISQNAVKYEVLKGDFRLSIKDVPHWTAKALTDHSGLISWTLGDRTVDFKNLSEEAVVVMLPRKALAEVGPGAIFQYSLMPRKQYAAAASGGPVKLHSADGEFSIDLQASNQLISFVPDEASRRKPGHVLHLNWDTGGPLLVSSAAAYATVRPGAEQVVQFPREAAAILTYSEGGMLAVQAVNHSFILRIEALNGLLIKLEDGDAVTMILDRRKGTFVVKAGTDNTFFVNVDTRNGFNPDLGANRALNFNIKKDGGVMATAGPSLVFFSPGSRELYSPEPDGTFISDTINQTPASVVRGPVLRVGAQ